MDFLDIFALIVLLTLLLSVVAGALVLGWLPGFVAAKRGHPQADAIKICGWLGLLSMGILLPIAYIWAFMKTSRVGVVAGTATEASVFQSSDMVAELRDVKARLAALEKKLNSKAPATEGK